MGRHSSLPIIYDFCRMLSVSDLKKYGFLKPNFSTQGVLTFISNNYDNFSLSIMVLNGSSPFVELEYLLNGKQVNYVIRFELVKSNLGKGNVWYFICPISNVKCNKLYYINGYFQHRSAYSKGLYHTQTLGAKDKFLVSQYEKVKKADIASSLIDSKYFKKHYKGKPTKKYLKLLKRIEEGGGISETALLLGKC